MSILVYTENQNGKFKNLSFELLSYACALGEKIQAEVHAYSIGKADTEELEKLALYGADKVHVLENTNAEELSDKQLTQSISTLARELNTTIVLLANNNSGKGIAPRISASLEAAYISAVGELPISTDPFIIRKKAFSGKAFTNIEANTDKKVLTLATNSYGISECKKEFELIQRTDEIEAGTFKVLNTQKQEGEILLSEADIVVSAGRGMKSPDNWAGIEEMAELLGAATACSRPVSDEGWRPHKEHVGQTGKVIAPNLYFAFGISGAIQHLAGVSSSKVIVAVNKDPEAPIFTAADYGIVGDVNVVMPKFIAAIKELE
jgi:electron transfer flavoprotein alpha subunit